MANDAGYEKITYCVMFSDADAPRNDVFRSALRFGCKGSTTLDYDPKSIHALCLEFCDVSEGAAFLRDVSQAVGVKSVFRCQDGAFDIEGTGSQKINALVTPQSL